MKEETRLVLTDSSDWSKIADRSEAATQIEENSYIPIPPLVLGVNTFNQFFAIFVNINEGKPTWRWAGTIARVFPFPLNVDTAPTGKLSSNEQSLFINRAQFLSYNRTFSQGFDFVYYPPKWFKDVRIRVYEFQGNTVNPRQEQLDRIEQFTDPTNEDNV